MTPDGSRSLIVAERQANILGAVRFAPTSASAREAHAAGQLSEWSQAFLRGEGGNLGIADPLRGREDDVYVLAEVDLGDVYPIEAAEPSPLIDATAAGPRFGSPERQECYPSCWMIWMSSSGL